MEHLLQWSKSDKLKSVLPQYFLVLFCTSNLGCDGCPEPVSATTLLSLTHQTNQPNPAMY